MHNILIVHQGHQWIRGSEKCLIDHIKHMKREQYVPHLWTNNNVLAEALRSECRNVVVDEFASLFSSDGRLSTTVHLLRTCRLLIRQYQIDLIHCSAPEPCQWVIPAARSLNVPVMLQLHLEYSLRLRVLSLTHQATIVVGVSKATVRQMLSDGFPEKHIRVVYNCVDPSDLDSHSTIDRQELGLADDIVVLAAGSLIKRKGFDILLSAFVEHADGATLLIAGDGPERENLSSQARALGISSRVVFLGERDDVPALMRDVADMFVLPARVEAFPMVLLEAGFFGVPCIATDVGGVSELISETAGIRVAPENAIELGWGIGEMIQSPERAKELGSSLRSRVREEMISPIATRRLEVLYSEYIGQPNRRIAFYPAYGQLMGNLFRRIIGVIRQKFRAPTHK